MLLEICELIVKLRVFCTLADAETALYNELWQACAGPLVAVPRQGERVFYFPQGHIEQVNHLPLCVCACSRARVWSPEHGSFSDDEPQVVLVYDQLN